MELSWGRRYLIFCMHSVQHENEDEFTKVLCNRCCPTHLIKNRFFEDERDHLRIYSSKSSLDVEDLKHFLEQLSVRSEIIDKIGQYELCERRLAVFTGLNYENISKLIGMLPSLKNSASRSSTQALVIFLFKLRTGNSNKVIASTVGLDQEAKVSAYCEQVIHAFEKDVLNTQFGIHAKTRDELIQNETSKMAKRLFNVTDKLVVIFDGTYITHQKSQNNEYQRRSYSGQKKKHLSKPFSIVTTTGYIIDTLGHYSANMNDASIMEDILRDPIGISSLMEASDICVVDRGFRDVIGALEAKQYQVKMPALKGKRNQLTTLESNESRFVTKIRWVVEAIHGILGQKYNLLHKQVDNKMLPKMKSWVRIASFLNNLFGKLLDSDTELFEEIIDRMESRRCSVNTLATKVEEEGLNRRKVPFKQLSSNDIIDFHELSEKELKILFTGSYQLKQAISYLAEMMDADNQLQMSCIKESPNILRCEIKSRHIGAKRYKSYIEYLPKSTGSSGIIRYCCDCANGNRTVGCCSHIAAVVYYLSHARYKSKIVKPAEILSKLFLAENIPAVINEDSDED